MKKYLVIISVFITCTGNAQADRRTIDHAKFAEPCGGMDSILARVGRWRHVEDDLAFPDKTFPRSQYKEVNKRVDTIHSFFKNTITDLRGFEPTWYRAMRGQSFTDSGPVPYSFQSLYFSY